MLITIVTSEAQCLCLSSLVYLPIPTSLISPHTKPFPISKPCLALHQSYPLTPITQQIPSENFKTQSNSPILRYSTKRPLTQKPPRHNPPTQSTMNLPSDYCSNNYFWFIFGITCGMSFLVSCLLTSAIVQIPAVKRKFNGPSSGEVEGEGFELR